MLYVVHTILSQIINFYSWVTLYLQIKKIPQHYIDAQFYKIGFYLTHKKLIRNQI
jgi:hypothetical protein